MRLVVHMPDGNDVFSAESKEDPKEAAEKWRKAVNNATDLCVETESGYFVIGEDLLKQCSFSFMKD